MPRFSALRINQMLGYVKIVDTIIGIHAAIVAIVDVLTQKDKYETYFNDIVDEFLGIE